MAVIHLDIFVPELDRVLMLFDRIQVQRSRSGAPFGDAVFITSDTATQAVLEGTKEGPFNVHSLDFKLKVDGGSEQTRTFVTGNPVSINRVVEELSSIAGIIADAHEGRLRIRSATNGTGSTLEVTGGTALSVLGFNVGDYDNGEDAHIALLNGVSTYGYDDGSGLPSYWYRTRFFNSVTKVVSSWSDWVQGTTGSVISPSLLIVGKVKLANLDGTPWVGAKVTIVNVYNPLLAEGYLVGGPNLTIETDGTGYGEVMLVRGATVDVIIERTSIIRRIIVPSSGTEFNLLDPSLVIHDAFGIQVPDLPAATRVTL